MVHAHCMLLCWPRFVQRSKYTVGCDDTRDTSVKLSIAFQKWKDNYDFFICVLIHLCGAASIPKETILVWWHGHMWICAESKRSGDQCAYTCMQYQRHVGRSACKNACTHQTRSHRSHRAFENERGNWRAIIPTKEITIKLLRALGRSMWATPIVHSWTFPVVFLARAASAHVFRQRGFDQWSDIPTNKFEVNDFKITWELRYNVRKAYW